MKALLGLTGMCALFSGVYVLLIMLCDAVVWGDKLLTLLATAGLAGMAVVTVLLWQIWTMI